MSLDFCTACGARRATRGRFCGTCGADLGALDDARIQTSAPAPDVAGQTAASPAAGRRPAMSTMVTALAIVAILAVGGVLAYRALTARPDGTYEEAFGGEQLGGDDVTGGGTTTLIDPLQWTSDGTGWDRYGPGYESSPEAAAQGVGYAHAYGSQTGTFSYEVMLDQPGAGTALLEARLSAESQGYSAPGDETSYVILAINGAAIDEMLVAADDGNGAIYSWTFPAELLTAGVNRVEFIVAVDSRSPHGLCIYGTAIQPGLEDAAIVLTTP